MIRIDNASGFYGERFSAVREMLTGGPLDVLTGFLDDDGNAQGRPVGVAVDKTGGLLVADDVGNVIWRVSKSQ